MKHLDSVDKVLDFAIKKEEEAEAFYMNLANRMKKQYMKDTFEAFAEEERGHKAKLLAVKEGKELQLERRDIVDLKIGEYVKDVKLTDDLSYQQALTVAMKAEKDAFVLYSGLAEKTDNDKLKELFLVLAQEEAKHKLRFEIEYDEEILQEN